MKAMSVLLTLLLALALVIPTVGCGDDDEETPTPVPTQGGEATPAATEAGYTGPSFNFTVSHSGTTESTTHSMYLLMDQLLQEKTNGKVKLTIYPFNTLYTSTEGWDALVTGALDICNMPDYVCQMNGLLNFMIGFIPMFFGETMYDVYDHDERFMEHPDGGQKLYADLETKGLKGLAIMLPGGFLQADCTARKEIKSFDDMKGWKTRSVGGITSAMIEGIDRVGVTVEAAEALVAFEQGLIDVIGSGIESHCSTNVYDIGKYFLVCQFVVNHTMIVMSLDKWNSLPAELQDIIENEVIPEVKNFFKEQGKIDEDNCMQTLVDAGCVINYQSDEERNYYRDKIFAMDKVQGYLGMMDPEMLKVADMLRSEPYDQGELIP